MFYDQRLTRAPAEIIRILNTNYRSSPQVTDASNRLLLVKNARFGSIDRESNYLVTCNSTGAGPVELLQDDDKIRRELNDKTRRSTRHAVMVMRAEDKEAAARWFQTPLIFSIQEAKGLEYESIILLNFISDSAAEFTEIANGVTTEDLSKELKYARAKDKTDKSLEAYKFYVNALYVALTRAVQNVYLVEKNPRHRLLDLLGLNTRKDALKMSEQKSTEAEWKAEARKLELQGKHEQAEQIRKTILTVQPVPWSVLSPSTLEDPKKQALDPNHFNKQAKVLLFEYAVLYDPPGIVEQLVRLLDARHMAFFLIHSMLACSQNIWRWKIQISLPAFETADFIYALHHFPEHIIPSYRRRRAYITSVLAGHEVSRDLPNNMQLFVRIALGKYILNPTMEIHVDDHWTNAYDLMHITELRQETGNKNLQSYLAHIDKVRSRLEARREPGADVGQSK